MGWEGEEMLTPTRVELLQDVRSGLMVHEGETGVVVLMVREWETEVVIQRLAPTMTMSAPERRQC